MEVSNVRSKNEQRFEVIRTTLVMIAVAGAALVALGARATAELTLPDGPNRELVSRTCGACHDLGTVIGAGGRSREGWDGTIDAMASFGLNMTPGERAMVLEYLATYLPPK